MTSLSRRAVWRAGGAALAAPAISRFAQAAEVTWRIGHVAPLDTPLHQSLLEAADAIAKRSEGRMELKVIGEGRAGVQSGLLAQVRSGGLEMAVAANSQLTSIVSICAIPAIGFLFTDYADLWTIMDGDLGRLIRTQTGTQLGLEVMDKIWDFGFRNVTTTTRELRTAADLTGLKIRTQIDSDEMDMFRAFDAVPIVITLPYLRMALEHHQIDGQEGLLQVVEYARLAEVQTFCAMTHHVWDGLWICANAQAWRALPERQRRIVANTLNGAALRQRDASQAQEASLRVKLAKAGMKFNDVDRRSFRDMLRGRGYYARLKSKLGEPAWAAILATAGKLD